MLCDWQIRDMPRYLVRAQWEERSEDEQAELVEEGLVKQAPNLSDLEWDDVWEWDETPSAKEQWLSTRKTVVVVDGHTVETAGTCTITVITTTTDNTTTTTTTITVT